MTTITELERLRELAEQATPGPATLNTNGCFVADEQIQFRISHANEIERALLVATRNLLTPSRITALIECVRALEAMVPMAKCYAANLNLSLSRGNAYKEIEQAETALSNLTSSCPTT